MTIKNQPSKYQQGKKSYERFKKELLAWKEITDLSSSKQGIAIA